MREISRFQRNAAQAAKSLCAGTRQETPEETGRRICQKFEKTGQEPVRMAAALLGYFQKDGIESQQREAFAVYLRAHIRNAVETLIEEDEPEKIARLEEQGWFGGRELDGFLKTARERQKTQALVGLLQIKQEKYGFQNQDNDLLL